MQQGDIMGEIISKDKDTAMEVNDVKQGTWNNNGGAKQPL